MKSAHKKAVVGKVIVYVILILIALIMIIPFLWMLSASIKSDRQVFQMNPFVWIPENPKISNYHDIWTKIPFDNYRYIFAVTDKQFCSVFFCKIAVSLQKWIISCVHSDDCNALAGLHGPTVYYDEKDGLE